MNLAVFDFDGTLTNRDTLFEFLKFYQGPFGYYFRLFILVPVFALYALKIIPNWKAKQMVLILFFKGAPLGEFQNKCNEFADKVIPGLIRSDARSKLSEHLNKNHRVVVISASPENWIKPWCDKMGIEYIATKLNTFEGALTGRISGRNCYGPEKVNRLKDYLNPGDFEMIYAYGDSKGDRELLALADKGYYKLFVGN